MGEYTLRALFRIMPKKYAETFISKGEMYLNTISYFRDAEREKMQDIFEGAETLFTPSKVFIGTENGFEELKNIVSQTPVRFYPDRYDSNIYCMYGIFENGGSENSKHIKNINSLLEKHPDNVAVIIYNIPDFLQRVENACKAINYTYQFSPVAYYNAKAPQQGLTPFNKSDEFIGENEYRIVIKGDGKNAIKLYLGDLRDITSATKKLEL